MNTQQSNSTANQHIKAEFVKREVYCNVNTLVEYCLKVGYEDRDAPFTIDDIENYYTYPEYYGEYAKFSGGTEEQRYAEIERLEELKEDSTPTDLQDYPDVIDDEIKALNNLETEPQEILEYWAVSSYLFDKLKEQGEPVLDAGSCYVWGRTTSGQAILLDSVISRICSNMGILEGQEHAWKV